MFRMYINEFNLLWKPVSGVWKSLVAWTSLGVLLGLENTKKRADWISWISCFFHWFRRLAAWTHGDVTQLPDLTELVWGSKFKDVVISDTKSPHGRRLCGICLLPACSCGICIELPPSGQLRRWRWHLVLYGHVCGDFAHRFGGRDALDPKSKLSKLWTLGNTEWSHVDVWKPHALWQLAKFFIFNFFSGHLEFFVYSCLSLFVFLVHQVLFTLQVNVFFKAVPQSDHPLMTDL